MGNVCSANLGQVGRKAAGISACHADSAGYTLLTGCTMQLLRSATPATTVLSDGRGSQAAVV
jgi:hypothetical protein